MFLFSANAHAQDSLITKSPFFERAQIYENKRLAAATAFGGIAYAGFSVGLYNSWYKNYPQSSFHFFDDSGEWNQVDKAGHVFSSYFQSNFIYRGARWTGLNENKSIGIGLLGGFLFQSTIEVMDGFSKDWGFSLTDMAANGVGLGVFYFQQKYFGEQKITLKESSWPIAYSNQPIMSESGDGISTVKERTDDLFGKTGMTKALKDYNVQTYWASFNVHSFLQPGNGWPAWLNVAIGYGAGNLYGGYTNQWTKNGFVFSLENEKRYRSYYLALDYDLRKLFRKNASLKTLMQVLDLYKWPAPALEYSTLDGFKFHLLFRS